MGDVVIKGDDVLGDSVNVASRIEAQAVPGGIAISQAVCDSVRPNGIKCRNLGLKELKNMPPQVLYHVEFDKGPDVPLGLKLPWKRVLAAAVLVLSVLVLAQSRRLFKSPEPDATDPDFQRRAEVRSSPEGWRLTMHPVPDGFNAKIKLVLELEPHRPLVPWVVAIPASEKAKLIEFGHGPAGHVPRWRADVGVIERDIDHSPMGPLHTVSTANLVGRGESIYLQMTELPSALWAGDDQRIEAIQLTGLR
jgi:hypothetical protein